MASGGISRERFKPGSRNFTHLFWIISLTNLPDMTSPATSGWYLSRLKKLPKIMPPTALGRILVAQRFAWPNNWWDSCFYSDALPNLLHCSYCKQQGCHFDAPQCNSERCCVLPDKESVGDETTLSTSSVKVNFSDLYGVLCRTLQEEQTTLLLYMFLHRIDAFKAFVLSRTNIDQLVGCIFFCEGN